ncbi:MAG: S9 family peptidase [Pirellulales bacterium]
MFKRITITCSELALWLVVLSMLLVGCTRSETGQEDENSATPKPLNSDAKRENAAMDDIPLIPREVLFGNPQRAQARLSPDGKWLSFLAPVEGVLNVWVGPVDDLSKAAPVTEDKKRGIRSHDWAYDARHILYTQDKDGDENWHVYATNVETRETKDLTPIEGVNARVQGVSEKFPKDILVGLNDRDAQHHDVWRVNIESGERELVQKNDGVAGYVIDDEFQVRFALDFTSTGGQVLLKREGEGDQQKWTDFLEFGPEDAMTSGPAGFDKSGRTLYLEDSRNRNTAGLFAMNLDSGDVKLVADDPRCDIGGVLAHPTEKNIQAVSFTYDRTEWKILDDAIAADFEYLKGVEDGEIIVASRTLDDKQWIVAFLLDDGPVKTYRYIRSPERKAIFLFNNRDDLADYPLVKMHAPVVKTRDGLDLVCYLSLPPGTDADNDGRPNKPVPMVLNVHGGPWARDGWGLNPYHQWLANRGYAVLSVNYRGSTGFGKEFINAANSEWAGKMHDDLIDAVNWAIDEKIALKDEVAIMGGSYGGYATLVGLTFTPEAFACGVDIVGPSSLVTLLQNVPEYWTPFMPVMKVRVGDVDTDEGRAELLKRSPLSLVDKIKRPLLIAQGANDPRVTQLEADQIVDAMKEKNIPVTYVLYPDEGHGFARPENRKSFNAVTEAFLAEQLGGRFEPVGNDFQGATITVPAGADQVPGLDAALAAVKKPAPQQTAPEAPANDDQPQEEPKPRPDQILEKSS